MASDFLYGAMINLGVFLLYMPPFVVFVSQHLLQKVRDVLKFGLLLAISFNLYVLMIILLPQAWGAFTFYFVAFHLFFFLASRIILDNVKAFSLAVYVCFAISVLWEWPLQIVFVQNLDALLMSSFKAMGIPFFYITLKRLGWRPRKEFYLAVILFFIIGLVLSLMINYGFEAYYWPAHLYRLPWLLLFTLNIMSLRAKDFYKWVEIKKI